MIIKDLLKGVEYKVLQGSDNKDVNDISWDSRKVTKGSLFICVKGKNVDRHDFAKQAVEAGASGLIVERKMDGIPECIDILQVENTREIMAIIASRFFGQPSEYMNIIGVTGTNGKTSVTWFIGKILEMAGRKAGVIGTIGNRVGDETVKVEKINPTTPDSMELQATLKEMQDKGATDVAMEVTSSALVNHRVDQCRFNIGVFTNLTQDHLDEHGTLENYKNAKLKLFKLCRLGVINADDQIFEDIKKSTTCKMLLTYGINNEADFMAEDIKYTSNGTEFSLNYHGIHKRIRTKLYGKHNVYNILAAIGTCHLSGLSLDQIIKGIKKIEGVKGRFEAIPNKKDCLVIVDYAHTPDGLENILAAARELGKKKIITVFGCGGDRDKTKRPIMGEIAGKMSDLCIITSDNPRSEEPIKIIEEIEVGLSKTSCSYEKIEDRKKAIFKALEIAGFDDIVVIAGKGHETYQILADRTIHFNDREVVEEYFNI